MTEVVWTFRRPWLFPCLFSVPLLSLGCLPSLYRSSLHHHCYLVKLKESSTVVKERADTAWVLTFIMVVDINLLQDPLLLLSVICCSSPCHGSWLLITRLCVHVCVYWEKDSFGCNSLLVDFFMLFFYLFIIRLAVLAFHVGSVRYTQNTMDFHILTTESIFLIDFCQHRCYRHSRIYSSGGMPLLE